MKNLVTPPPPPVGAPRRLLQGERLKTHKKPPPSHPTPPRPPTTPPPLTPQPFLSWGRPGCRGGARKRLQFQRETWTNGHAMCRFPVPRQSNITLPAPCPTSPAPSTSTRSVIIALPRPCTCQLPPVHGPHRFAPPCPVHILPVPLPSTSRDSTPEIPHKAERWLGLSLARNSVDSVHDFDGLGI